MRVLLNKRLHVNMGNYEHVELVSTVEVNTETDTEILWDNGVDVNDMEQVHRFLKENTDMLLEDDLIEASLDTDEENSFVHEYVKQKYNRKN